VNGPWLTELIDRGVVHVVPVADLVDHSTDEACVCMPSAEVVLNDQGPDGHVYAHHSLDGRELLMGDVRFRRA